MGLALEFDRGGGNFGRLWKVKQSGVGGREEEDGT